MSWGLQGGRTCSASATLYPSTIQQATHPVNSVSCAETPGIRWAVAVARQCCNIVFERFAQPVTTLSPLGAGGIIGRVLGGPHNDPTRHPRYPRVDSRRVERAVRPDSPFTHWVR